MEKQIITKKAIAIVGHIGSGKTTAIEYLRQKKYCVIDCDAISKAVAEEQSVVQKIAEVFGRRFVSGGKILRKELSEYVFSDKEKVAELNEIFHEKVIKNLQQNILEAQSSVVFVEIQVLEQKTADLFEQIWLIESPLQSIFDRVNLRDGRTANATTDIIQNQRYNLDLIKQNYDFKTKVIFNDSDILQFYKKIDKLISAL